MELYKRGKYYWVTFSVDGKRRRVGTKEVTRTAATARAMEMILEAKTERVRRGSILEPVEVPTLREFANGWFKNWYMTSARISDGTREYYAYGVSLLDNQPIMSMRLDEITAEDADMIVTRGAASTHNCALRTLRRMLNLAVARDLILKAPKFRLLEENERTDLVEPNIEAKIAAVLANQRKCSLKTALYLMLDAGMRPCEIVRLRVEDVNFERGWLFVRCSKTKAGKRYLPLTARMKEKLFAAIGEREEGYIFRSSRREAGYISPKSLSHAWRETCRRADVAESVKLYCARHTFGTDAMIATKNAFLVMKALGHTELSTTERYQHHDIAQLGEQMNARNAVRASRMLN